MWNHCLIKLPFVAAVLVCTFVAHAEISSTELVNAYFKAYNAHNVERMLAIVTDDIRWMSVDGNSIALEADGKESLGDAMLAHFARSPSTRSEVRDISALGDFVTVIEAAMRDSNSATGAQCAIAVYQFSEGLIANVWYYAARPCEQTAD